MAATKEQLQLRWVTQDGKDRLRRIVELAREHQYWKPVLDGFPHVEETGNGRDLRGAMLSGADLKGVDLNLADLGESHLNGANLSGANLSGAVLKDVDLYRTDLRCANLTGSNLRGAFLAEANLSGAGLATAELSGADLSQADLRGANFDRVSINRPHKLGTAEFGYAKFDRTTSFLGVDISRTNWSGNPLLKRHIQDQQWLEAWRNKSSLNDKFLYPLWLASCDCGRSFWRWLGCCLVLAGLFGILFWWPLNGSIAVDTGPNGDRVVGPVTYFYYSLVTFTTLGFGDVTPRNWIGELFVMMEVFLGYVMLGGLISIFATKLARRG